MYNTFKTEQAAKQSPLRYKTPTALIELHNGEGWALVDPLFKMNRQYFHGDQGEKVFFTFKQWLPGLN